MDKKIMRSADQKQMSLSLPVWLYDELHNKADELSQSVSGLIRLAVIKYLGIEKE